MTQRLVSEELLRQLLERLEHLHGVDTETECVTIDLAEEIDALRTALEQPAQQTCGRCVVFCQGGEGCHCNTPQISQREREQLISDQINRRSPAPQAQQPAPVQEPAVNERAQFNAAIDFAILQGIEAGVFLDAWRHGDTSEWPEFQPPQAQEKS